MTEYMYTDEILIAGRYESVVYYQYGEIWKAQLTNGTHLTDAWVAPGSTRWTARGLKGETFADRKQAIEAYCMRFVRGDLGEEA